MVDNNIWLIFLSINSLLVGYLLGRFTSPSGVNNNSQSFFSKNKNEIKPDNNFSIDDRKFVVDINTSGLEKKYNNLGDVKNTEDNISSSVNKLKNLKR